MNAKSAPRAVLDTNVVLDLFVWQNPEAAPLRDAVQGGAIACLADAEGLAELERVLGYPKLALDPAAQARIHGQYAALVRCPPADAFFAIIPRCSDRDDQKFLELAVRQRADLLFSRDKALLKLAKRIRKIAPQLEILTPNEWMSRRNAAPAMSHSGRTPTETSSASMQDGHHQENPRHDEAEAILAPSRRPV